MDQMVGHAEVHKRATRGAEKTPSKSRRMCALAIAGGALALSLAGFAAYYFTTLRNYVSTDDAFVDAQIVQIAPRVSGRVAHINVSENEIVSAGAPLVSLEDENAAATLALRQAQTESARAHADQLRAQLEETRSLLDEASADVAGKTALAKKADLAFSRRRALRRESPATVSDSEYDQYEAAAKSAESALSAAKAHVGAVRLQQQSAAIAVRIAEADVAVALAQEKIAQTAIDRLSISAPISGRVTKVSVNAGSIVAPQTPLMALVPDDIYITANLKETQLERVRPGQPVSIKIDAYPGIAFNGRVESIQPGAGQAFQLLPPQNATGNFVKVVQRVPVRISLDRSGHEELAIGPGMSVRPHIRVRP